MFSTKSSQEKTIELSDKTISKLISICCELSARRQSARTLDLINSKEVDKLIIAVNSGSVSLNSLSDIADANVLWSTLVNTLRRCEKIITTDMANATRDGLSDQISDMPFSHRRLMGALVSMIETLGENNVSVARTMTTEIGTAIISPGSDGIYCNKDAMILFISLVSYVGAVALDDDLVQLCFLRMSTEAPALISYRRDFQRAARVEEIDNAHAFWSAVAGHDQAASDSTIDRQSDTSVGGHECDQEGTGGGRRRKLDRQRDSLHGSLHIDSDLQAMTNFDDYDGIRQGGRLPPPEPLLPSANVPFPPSREPVEGRSLSSTMGQDNKEVSGSAKIPLTARGGVRGEGPDTNTKNLQDVWTVFERIGDHTKGADVRYDMCEICLSPGMDTLIVEVCSAFIRELRSCFGTSSTKLRNELITYADGEGCIH